jgi:hypothetical protein
MNATARKVTRLLGDLETYVSGQSAIIIDYATARSRTLRLRIPCRRAFLALAASPLSLRSTRALPRFPVDDERRLPRPPFGCPAVAHGSVPIVRLTDLGLPVPPVVLWDRGDQNDSLHCFCATSLITFQPSNKWSVIHSVPVIRDRLLPEFTLAASGMIAFDT